MDYLANYYKNLSEQLQEKINVLEVQLNELYMPNYPRRTLSKEDITNLVKGYGISKNRRNPDNPEGPPLGHIGDEEGYWETPPQHYGGTREEPRWVSGKREPWINKSTGKPIDLSAFGITNKKPSQTSAQSSGESDEEIYRMRQTAADQGGIPQDMVNAPITRTKQMSDGTLIYGTTPERITKRPNIDGVILKRPNPPFKPIPNLKERDTVVPIPNQNQQSDANRMVPLVKKEYEEYPLIDGGSIIRAAKRISRSVY